MRAEKQLLLDEIRDKIEGTSSFIVARYQGMTTEKARTFRDIVAQAKGEFEVVRKRVFLKAVQAAGLQLNVEILKGHIGVIFTDADPAELSKIALKYSEENEKAIQIIAGQIQGEIYSGEDLEALAKLPPLEELRAQFLGLLEAPMGQTLAVMDAVMTSVPYCF